MTKKEAGEVIFKQIKADLKLKGNSLDTKHFPKDYPISKATVYNIKNGIFTEQIVEKLPFKVVISYNVFFEK